MAVAELNNLPLEESSIVKFIKDSNVIDLKLIDDYNQNVINATRSIEYSPENNRMKASINDLSYNARINPNVIKHEAAQIIIKELYKKEVASISGKDKAKKIKALRDKYTKIINGHRYY